MPTQRGSVRAGHSDGPEQSLAHAIELIAADAPLSETLAWVVEAIERAGVGLSAVISLSSDDHAEDETAHGHDDFPPHSHCEPLRLGRESAIGAVIVSSRPPRPLSAPELAFVASAARVAALAVEHMRLRDAAAGYSAIVERMPAIVYIADAGVVGCWYYIGPQIESVLGFSREEFPADPELWVRPLQP